MNPEAQALMQLVQALAVLAQALEKMSGPKRPIYQNGRVVELVPAS